jgi:hypothetical protein
MWTAPGVHKPALVPCGIGGAAARGWSGGLDSHAASPAKPPGTPFTSKLMNEDGMIGRTC